MSILLSFTLFEQEISLVSDSSRSPASFHPSEISFFFYQAAPRAFPRSVRFMPLLSAYAANSFLVGLI